ncbi:DNA lesion error-prone repair protein ImuA, partial [Pseudomonas syringae]
MMGAVVSLDALLDERRVWKGRQQSAPQVSPQPSGHALLDAALPTGGWPAAALTEILIPANGSGELRLLWPSLARLSAIAERIVLVAPPYIPYPQAWLAAGVDLRQLVVIEASNRDALWA